MDLGLLLAILIHLNPPGFNSTTLTLSSLSTGGTFAHLHILPLKEALDVAAGAPPATNAPVPHRLDQRCRVEVKRI